MEYVTALWKRITGAEESKAAVLLNPRLGKLLKLPDEKQQELIDIFMKVRDSCPEYKDIIDVPIWRIIEIRSVLQKEVEIEEIIYIIHLLNDRSYKKLARLQLLDVCNYYKFAINGIERIIELEKKLKATLRAKDYRAGVERMDKYSDLIGLKTVADYYNEKIEDAEKRTYKECYSVWMLNKEQREIDIKYLEQQ